LLRTGPNKFGTPATVWSPQLVEDKPEQVRNSGHSMEPSAC
jgi:hypothetical protein